MNRDYKNLFNEAIDGFVSTIEEIMKAIPQGKTLKAQAASEKATLEAGLVIAGLLKIKNDYKAIDTAGLIDILKAKIIMGADNVNSYADMGDNSQNWRYYGALVTAAQTLLLIGVNIDVDYWIDKKGFARIPTVVIDGKVTDYPNGKQKICSP